MNNKKLLALTATLGLCSTNFIFASAVSAQMSWETQQLLNDTNSLVREAGDFIQDVEQQRQQEMNALNSACNSGDSNACLEYEMRLNAEDRAIDQYIETVRNRKSCGSPVCY